MLILCSSTCDMLKTPDSQYATATSIFIFSITLFSLEAMAKWVFCTLHSASLTVPSVSLVSSVSHPYEEITWSSAFLALWVLCFFQGSELHETGSPLHFLKPITSGNSLKSYSSTLKNISTSPIKPQIHDFTVIVHFLTPYLYISFPCFYYLVLGHNVTWITAIASLVILLLLEHLHIFKIILHSIASRWSIS